MNLDRATFSDLCRRFDRAGPRYTSYPTALEFSDEFKAQDYEARLLQADSLGETPLSLYVHLPFCLERCLYCGCHVIITKKTERALPYLNLLEREFKLVGDRLPRRRKFSQLHLGGGTPTYYSDAELGQLVSSLLSHFEPLSSAELAIEVDPRVTTDSHIDTLAALGFNRMSVGVQDFTPTVQEHVNRVQSVQETERILERGRARGFRGINVDLIYGLPAQTPETFDKTLDSVIELGPDRVAAYSFAYVPWIRGHQKKMDESLLPSREIKLELLALIRERLLGAGFVAIGMDHFARPDDELAIALHEGRLRRNFQGYAVIPGEDVLGFGISAIGDVRGAYCQNEKKLSRYADAIKKGELPVERGIARTADDEARREIIHALMCTFAVDKAKIAERFNLVFDDYFAPDLELLHQYQGEGLVEIQRDRIDVTELGQIFVRNLAMCFDRYLRERHTGSKPVFSRTV